MCSNDGGVLSGCGSNEGKQAVDKKDEVTAPPKEVTPTMAAPKPTLTVKPQTENNSIEKDSEDFSSEESSSSSVQNNSSSVQEESSFSEAEDNQTEEISEQGWDSMVLYDIDMNGIQVTRGEDGNWYDENGVSYGDLDNADETQPIINENGDTWYWNGAYAQQAAEEDSDSSLEDSSGTEDISDPFDLYSWDAGTGQYIPFQQAETDAQPVGRGNGWYYYDEASGEYLPW